MSSKELIPSKERRNPNFTEGSKTKKIRKGRKKSAISNFLLITFNMIEVEVIRIPRA